MQAGMKIYKEKGIKDLEDCDPTIKLIERIDNVAKAMNSGGSQGALWPNSKEE